MKTTSWKEVRDRKLAERPGMEERVVAGVQAIKHGYALQDIRKAQGLTQAQVAERLHQTPVNISRVERENDVYLSTLRAYVEAMGGKLELVARFDENSYPIGIAGQKKSVAS